MSLSPRTRFLSSSLSSLLLIGLQVSAAPSNSSTNRFEKDIQAFEKADRSSAPPPGQILFIGSSSIRVWKSLKEDFPDKQIVQRGFGGSQISDSIEFAHRIILPYKPRQIVLYAGDNDINKGKSPGQVATDFQQLISIIHRDLPETRISFIAIKPSLARLKLAGQMSDANQRVRKLSEANPLIDFIDISTPMLGADGKPRADLFDDDDLHLNEKGYQLWTNIIRPYLK